MTSPTFPCLGLQEKAGADLADTDVSKPQELQFPSLESALKTDWSSLHPRRSHKLICLLAGDHWTNCSFRKKRKEKKSLPFSAIITGAS